MALVNALPDATNKYSIKNVVDKIGKFVSWSIVLIVLMLIFEVAMRYIFNAPSIWSSEVIMYIYAFYIPFLLGYTLIYDKHIRVDVIYSKYSKRKKYFVDIIGYIVFFFVFCIGVIIGAYNLFKESLFLQERTSSIFSIILWPKRLALLLSFLLLLFVGISDFLEKLLYFLEARKIENSEKEGEHKKK